MKAETDNPDLSSDLNVRSEDIRPACSGERRDRGITPGGGVVVPPWLYGLTGTSACRPDGAPVVAQPKEELYDESNWWLDGWTDDDLGSSRRTSGCRCLD